MLWHLMAVSTRTCCHNLRNDWIQEGFLLKRTTVEVMNNLWIEFLVRNFIIILEDVCVLVLPLFCVGSHRQYP